MAGSGPVNEGAEPNGVIEPMRALGLRGSDLFATLLRHTRREAGISRGKKPDSAESPTILEVRVKHR